MRLVETDVLVLGAGLAGLRAAWAALDGKRKDQLRVTVAWAGRGPSGSSFANRNDGWGLLAPQNDAERERFVSRALEIAPPGRIAPSLLAILAEESASRLHELQSLGIRPLPRSSRVCFAPDLRAAVFRDSHTLFPALAEQIVARGGVLLPGVQALTILRRNDTACGALLVDDTGELVLHGARAVICALGGPAPLFPRHVAGTENPGTAPAILAEAGVTLDNLPYLQWMWHDLDSGRFAPIDRLAGGSVSIGDGETPLPHVFAALAGDRASHFPRAYDLPSEAMDMHLGRIACSGDGKGVRIRQEGASPLRILPHAHAANGGARIDALGRTNVPGLWACGECATGMHGANRLGGAMVAAALVFGRRAGMNAGIHARQAVPVAEGSELKEFAKLWIENERRNTSQDVLRPDPHRILRALFLRKTDEARDLLVEFSENKAAHIGIHADSFTKLIIQLAGGRLRKALPSTAA
ncbi:FAD-dependent oxidoreductase [Oceanidesulfovibrio indonesiensis]|uniref:FAD-dependent oxidoreductase n=1 Tax=Oceanidesulfovibrio indonesiensis TaxID=54767 RepID=A0A7M3MAA9_9BACT|nr:FAD-binding protein [Oceanidesulfovibrio indonesiensis]TVM14552.1 FAD-dependent oxidoreductase [Oceanidesulfovibrio indonesiensis]